MNKQQKLIDQASVKFAKALHAACVMTDETRTAQFTWIKTQMFKMNIAKTRLLELLETHGFKTILISTDYEILSKSVKVGKTQYLVQVCVWPKRFTVRYLASTGVGHSEVVDLTTWMHSLGDKG